MEPSSGSTLWAAGDTVGEWFEPTDVVALQRCLFELVEVLRSRLLIGELCLEPMVANEEHRVGNGDKRVVASRGRVRRRNGAPTSASRRVRDRGRRSRFLPYGGLGFTGWTPPGGA